MLAKRVLFHKTYYQLTKITKKVRKTNKERYDVCFNKLMELCNETK